jgi:hypothetical protein
MFMLVDETIENRGTSKTLYLYCFLVCFLQGYREGYACLTNPRSQRLFRSLGGDLVVSLDAAEHFRKLGVSFEGQPGTVAVGVLDLPRALRGLGSLAVRFLGRR